MAKNIIKKEIIFIQPRNHNNIKDFIELLSNFYKITLLSYENNNFLKSSQVRYKKLKYIRLNKKKEIRLPSFLQLYKKITNKKKIIIKNLNSIESLFSLLICRIKGINNIVMIQKINLPGNNFFRYIYLKLYRFLLKRSKVLSQTNIGLKESRKYFNKGDFLPFGIKIKNNIKKKQHEGINFLCVSKIQKRKNILNLIKAFKKLCERNNSLKLFVAAREIKDYDYYNKIKDYIKNNNISNIKIMIGLDQKEMENLYLKSDAFLLVSSKEPAAYSNLEAANYNLPLILTNENGTSDYFAESKDCYVLKGINSQNIYEGMNDFLKNYNKKNVLIKPLLKDRYDINIVAKKFIQYAK
jgi:glycosyltransferase involved in cell wall biosynthesis